MDGMTTVDMVFLFCFLLSGIFTVTLLISNKYLKGRIVNMINYIIIFLSVIVILTGMLKIYYHCNDRYDTVYITNGCFYTQDFKEFKEKLNSEEEVYCELKIDSGKDYFIIQSLRFRDLSDNYNALIESKNKNKINKHDLQLLVFKISDLIRTHEQNKIMKNYSENLNLNY